MAKSRQRKGEELEKFTDILRKAKTIVFSGFAGLTVKEATELRRTLRQEGISLTVVKRTLFRKAAQTLKLPEPPAEVFLGGSQIAYGSDDETAPARLLHSFAKTHQALTLRAGYLNGQLFSSADVLRLAQLPTKDELRGQLVRLVAAPLRGLISVLSGPWRGFLTVLSKKGAPTA